MRSTFYGMVGTVIGLHNNKLDALVTIDEEYPISRYFYTSYLSELTPLEELAHAHVRDRG